MDCLEKICLDSDILIDFLRNKKEAVEFIKQHENVNILGTTLINLFELYYGASLRNSQKEILAIEILKERLALLNLQPASAQKAGEIAAELEKSGQMLDFRDILIGTISLMHGFSLKTYNKKDFTRIHELKLIE